MRIVARTLFVAIVVAVILARFVPGSGIHIIPINQWSVQYSAYPTSGPTRIRIYNFGFFCYVHKRPLLPGDKVSNSDWCTIDWCG